MRLYALLWLACLAPGFAAQNPDFQQIAKQAGDARAADRLDDAADLYRKALALNAGWAEGWWDLGTVLYDRDNYADAAAALRKSVALSPNSANALAMLGLCEAQLGQEGPALEHLSRSRKLGLNDQDLYQVASFNEARLLLAAGKFSQAQEILDGLARHGANQGELLDALGEAVLGIRPADLATVPTPAPEVMRQAGRAEQIAAQGILPPAAEAYARLAADYPKFHNVQFAYGRFLLANHFDDQAIAAFRREIENTPQHLLARLGLAGILLNTDPAAGIPYALEAVRLAPDLAEGHYLLGMLYLSAGPLNKAIAELEAAQHLGPNDARVYFALGNAYAKAHRMDDAARARQTFARLNKENSQ